MNIGMIIKDARTSKNMTMKYVAERVGVSEGTISRWESGNIKNMRRDKIAKLASTLDLDPSVIMGWSSPASENIVDALNLTKHERDLIIAYRNHPDQQASVDKLLDLPTVAKNAPVDKNATA